jgi:HTH-type transcriptional regulator / antitoxin HigA
MVDTAPFSPDWLSPPGETVRDIVSQGKMSMGDLAHALDASDDEIRELLDGRLPVSEELAGKLAASVGGTSAFWMRREKRYRTALDDLLRSTEQGEGPRWLKTFPVADMVRFGWLAGDASEAAKATACLRFFGVDSVSAWEAAYADVLKSAVFRTSRSFESTPGAVAAWLRRGELESTVIRCAQWQPEKLEHSLTDLRRLTREIDPEVFLPRLRAVLSDCGVAFVVLRAPAGCRASGASKFLTDTKALMLISVRYLSDDQFWFSVFHEVGHLLKHPRRLFIDAPSMPSNREEEEASRFAEDTLVPAEHRPEMMKLPVNGRAVMRFARKIGIAPGIVVGQLQHAERFKRQQLNNLKRRYRWGD